VDAPYNPWMATRTRHAATVAPRLSVIVLVYNEVESVAPLHEELIGVLDAIDSSYEVLYIDDGSRDGSTERLGQLASRDAHVRVVSFRRNFGQTAAVQAGIDKLSADLRTCVILRDIEELSYQEIVDLLKIPEGTVKSRINRGRIELAKILRRMRVVEA